MYYCYILYSPKLDRYYIGSTKDLQGRLRRHNSSGEGYTSTGKPWGLVYAENFTSKSGATDRELQLKSWKSSVKLRELIAGNKNSLNQGGASFFL